MDNSKLPSNILIQKIKESAKNNDALTLTAEEVQTLAEAIGKLRFIPVYTMDQLNEELNKKDNEKKEL